MTYDYDGAGELTAIRWADSHLADDKIAGFAYDDLGRRTGIVRGNNKASTGYAYDPADLRLSSLTQDPSGAADDVVYGLAYNAAGQVRRRTISNGAYAWSGAYVVDRPYAVDGLNRVVDAGTSGQSGYTTYGHDGRGNLLCVGAAASACAGPTTRYKYDAENRLRGTTAGAALVYDPLGRLYASTTVGGTVTRYLYDGANLIGEYDASATAPLRRYVFGPGADEPLARYAGGGATPEWLLADHQGSIIAITDSSGVVTSKGAYDEYGVPGPGNSGLFQYTGQVYLADLSLYHYKARAYSPTLGRFLQTDPIGYKDDLNLYAYVGNDPLNKTDPTGNLQVAEGAAAGCALTGPGCPAGAAVGAGIGAVVLVGGAACAASEGCRGAVADTGRATGDAVGGLIHGNDEAKASDRPPGSDGKTGSTGGPGAGKRFKPESPEAKAGKEGVPCAYCGRPTTNEPGQDGSRERDHIDPKSRGGNNSPDNERDSCRSCNRGKGSRNPDEWKPNRI